MQLLPLSKTNPAPRSNYLKRERGHLTEVGVVPPFLFCLGSFQFHGLSQQCAQGFVEILHSDSLAVFDEVLV
ncbi:hypothetical protein ABIB48_002004 [Arthrobacter sp. UYCu511]